MDHLKRRVPPRVTAFAYYVCFLWLWPCVGDPPHKQTRTQTQRDTARSGYARALFFFFLQCEQLPGGDVGSSYRKQQTPHQTPCTHIMILYALGCGRTLQIAHTHTNARTRTREYYVCVCVCGLLCVSCLRKNMIRPSLRTHTHFSSLTIGNTTRRTHALAKTVIIIMI